MEWRKQEVEEEWRRQEAEEEWKKQEAEEEQRKKQEEEERIAIIVKAADDTSQRHAEKEWMKQLETTRREELWGKTGGESRGEVRKGQRCIQDVEVQLLHQEKHSLPLALHE